MRNRVCVFVLFALCGGLLSAQTKSAPAANCADYKALLAQVWEMERHLTDGVYDTPSPATEVRQLSERAKELRDQLAVCAITWHGSQDVKTLLAAENRSFAFIIGVQKENAGMALGSENMVLSRSDYPVDLVRVAPLCDGVVDVTGSPNPATKLVQQIETFHKNHDPSAVTLKDVTPFSSQSDSLLSCAFEAYTMGYKDAAFRILNADLMLESMLYFALSNEQAAVVKAVQSASRNARAEVRIGPQFCSASILDFGWQKTISWDCY